MGAELLMMQRWLLQGGGDEQQQEIETRLRQSLSFLKARPSTDSRDEIRMILDTAERLKLRVIIQGNLPETQPLRHILATALHECMTNTLRHAGGNRLTMTLLDAGDWLQVRLTNNGAQPTEPIRESGGLKSLRTMTEQAGGSMRVQLSPVFAVCLELPKEVEHAISGSDCG